VTIEVFFAEDRDQIGEGVLPVLLNHLPIEEDPRDKGERRVEVVCLNAESMEELTALEVGSHF